MLKINRFNIENLLHRGVTCYKVVSPATSIICRVIPWHTIRLADLRHYLHSIRWLDTMFPTMLATPNTVISDQQVLKLDGQREQMRIAAGILLNFVSLLMSDSLMWQWHAPYLFINYPNACLKHFTLSAGVFSWCYRITISHYFSDLVSSLSFHHHEETMLNKTNNAWLLSYNTVSFENWLDLCHIGRHSVTFQIPCLSLDNHCCCSVKIMLNLFQFLW